MTKCTCDQAPIICQFCRSEAFEKFWDAYPFKVLKHYCRKVFLETDRYLHIEKILLHLNNSETHISGGLSPWYYLKEKQWENDPVINGILKEMHCAECGKDAVGRQWPTQDVGYSLCVRCAQTLKKRLTPQEMYEAYGREDENYFIN